MLVLAAVAAGTLAGAGRADQIGSKRAQAQQVLNRLRQLDANAQRANNRYQVASTKLHALESQLTVNKQALGVARSNLRTAQTTLAARLVAIYTTRDEQSTLAVILGSHNLSDLVNRIETVQSVSKQDSAVIQQVGSFQRQIVTRRVFLRHARVEQKRLVRVRAAAKARIDDQVHREQRLYDSVKGELDKLVAQARARQLAAARLAAIRAAALADNQVQNSFGASASADGTTVAPPSRYTGAVAIAMRYLGTPYVWGGSTPPGSTARGS